MSAVRVVDCDGSVESARAVAAALADALAGGPAVLPVPAGEPPPASRAPVSRAPASRAPVGRPGGAAGRARLLEAARPQLPSDAALLVATSGSAGEPKVVELPAAALLASAAATHERLGGPGRWLLALPALHIAGLMVLVRAASAGGAPAVLDLRGGFRADSFALAAGRAGARYTALVPTQLARLLDAGGAAHEALCRFEAVLLGGAATPPALLDRARAAGVNVVRTYGMTETAGGCVYDGLALPGVRVRLDGARRVHLAGPMLAAGYRLRPDLTAAAFDGGWFRTGDVGQIRADGTLEVLGRTDDLIVTGGRKVAPAQVERALDASPAVAESCVVGLPDAHWGQLVAALVVPAEGAGPDPDELRARVRELAGPAAVPKLIEVVTELPRRGIGKVDRDAVQGYLIGRRQDRSQATP